MSIFVLSDSLILVVFTSLIVNETQLVAEGLLMLELT